MLQSVMGDGLLQSLMGAHEQFKATLGEADAEFRQLMGLEREIARLIDAHGLDRELLHNPYCPLGGGGLQQKWQEVQSLVPRRENQLHQEMQRQKCTNCERLLAQCDRLRALALHVCLQLGKLKLFR